MSSFQDFQAILPLLIKLSLWCALPFLLRPLLRRWSAARRHLILTLVLAGSIALPALWILAPAWPAPSFLRISLAGDGPKALPDKEAGRDQGSHGIPRAPGVAAASPSPAGDFLLQPPATGQGGRAVSSYSYEVKALAPAQAASRGPQKLSAPAMATPSSSAKPKLAPLVGPGLLLAWALGLALMIAWVVVSIHRVKGIVSRAKAVADQEALAVLSAAQERLKTRGRPQLVASSETTVPFAWGGDKGAIVLPESWYRWSPQRLDVVLVHELAHLHRRDTLALAVGRIATALWWFHPIVHGLDAWARRDCEQATDDAVLLSGSRASDYANHLIAIGRSLKRPLPAGVSLMMSNRPDLKSRLLAILRADQPRQGLSRNLVWGASLLILGFAVALAGIRFSPTVSAQESPEKHRGATGEAESHHDADHDHHADHHHDGDHKSGYSYAYSTSDRGQSSWDKAYEAHNEGRYDEAIAGFEKAAEEGIRPATSTYNAACGYALNDQPDQALATLRKAMDLGLDSPELLAEDSDLDPLRADPRFQALVDEAFAKAGETRDPIRHYRYRTSQETLRLLQEQGSEDPKAWAKVGLTLMTTGQLDDAVLALGNSVRFDPEPGGNSHYNLACAHALAGQKIPALEALEKAIHAGYSDPKHMKADPDLRSLRGDRQFKELTELAHALDLDRFRKALWEERSLTSKVIRWVSKGDHSEYAPEVWAPAIDFYEDFTKKNPGLGAGWFNLGYALHFSKRFDEAEDAFRKARDHGFRPSTSTYNIACGLAMRGRVDAALDSLEEAIELGFDSSFKHDSDLDNLRSDERFRALALQQELRQKHG